MMDQENFYFEGSGVGREIDEDEKCVGQTVTITEREKGRMRMMRMMKTLNGLVVLLHHTLILNKQRIQWKYVQPWQCTFQYIGVHKDPHVSPV